MLEKINNYIYYCLVLLVAMLPFHAFLKTWFSSLLTETNIDSLSSGSFMIGAWKEVLLVFLFFILCLKLIVEFVQKKKLPFRLRSFDYALLAFTICLLASPLWTNFEWVAYVWAVKTNLSFVIAYFDNGIKGKELFNKLSFLSIEKKSVLMFLSKEYAGKSLDTNFEDYLKEIVNAY